MKRLAPVLLLAVPALAAEPVRLHPDNPHYYLFRGRPTVLITSAEHYGAVLNGDFNYIKYLDTLAADGLNLTRIFSGVYYEIPGDFGITRNTLAPEPARFVSPYLKVSGKYDLTKWNPAFFKRLHSFVAEASKRGIVVELSLFCVFYEDRMWDVSPLNARNNVQGIGKVPRQEVLTLRHPDLLNVQAEFVRKIVTELKDYDNVIFEICNEPYVRDLAPDDWQRHIAKVIHDTEAALPARHLIARNIANFAAKVDSPDPRVSVLNFHYARPPVTVAQNWSLNRVLGLDETGFDGTLDAVYRIQAWDFLLAGGAHYNNLDYSFAVGHEDGSFLVPGNAPGGGSAALRKQLKILHDFMGELDFVHMTPSDSVLRGSPGDGFSARALAAEGKTYAIYIHSGRAERNRRPRYTYRTDRTSVTVSVNLPAGRWHMQWWDTRTGKMGAGDVIGHDGGHTVLPSPEFTEDIAVVLRAR